MTVTELDASDVPWECCARPGCTGVRSSHATCLAHLDGEERATALRLLGRGRPLDARGVRFDAALLTQLLDATPCDDAGRPILKAARFDRASFAPGAGFDRVVFAKEVSFDRAHFEGDAPFEGARFDGHARFARALVAGRAVFDGATFGGQAWFGGARFKGPASFERCEFAGMAWFAKAEFATEAEFAAATFRGDATFDGARFDGRVGFAGAAFAAGAALERALFHADPDYRGTTFSDRGAVPKAAVRQAIRTGVAFARWPARAGAALIDAVVPAATVCAAILVGVALQVEFHYEGAVATFAGVGGVAAVVVVVRALVEQGHTGQTRGKRRLGIRLVGERDGHPIGPRRSVARHLLHVVDAVPLAAGWLRPLWHRKRQTFADTLVGAVVVKGAGWNRPPKPEAGGSCC